MSSFVWFPDPGATKTPKARVIDIQFGDGYCQRQSYGLNSVSQEWNLSFSNRPQSESDAIDSFLSSMGGVQAFDFTPPDQSSPIKVICRSGNWSKQVLIGSIYNLTAKFEQVFEP